MSAEKTLRDTVTALANQHGIDQLLSAVAFVARAGHANAQWNGTAAQLDAWSRLSDSLDVAIGHAIDAEATDNPE